MNEVKNEQKKGSKKEGSPGNMGLQGEGFFVMEGQCLDICFCLVGSLCELSLGPQKLAPGSFLQAFVSLTPPLWTPQHGGRKGQCPGVNGPWRARSREEEATSHFSHFTYTSQVCHFCFLLGGQGERDRAQGSLEGHLFLQ